MPKIHLPGVSIRSLGIVQPNPFGFVTQTDVAVGILITSNSVTVTGTPPEVNLNISVNLGEFEINNSGTWLSAPSAVSAGDTVKVRHTSSTLNNTTIIQSLNINGIIGTFTTITTVAATTVKYQVQNFQLPSGSIGSQTTINTTETGFGIPTGVLIIRAGHWQSFFHFEANHNMSIGASNVTNTSTISWMVDGEDPGSGGVPKTGSHHDSIRAAVRRQSSVTNPREGYKVVNFVADGMVLEVTEDIVGGAEHQYFATAIFFTGTGIEAFEPFFVDDMGTDTTPVVVSGLDNPDVAFFYSVGINVPVTTVEAETFGAGYSEPKVSFGVATANGDQACVAIAAQETMTTNVTAAIYDTCAVAAVNNGAEIYRGTVGSWTATGFTITPSADSGSRIVGGVALKLATNIQATIVPVDIPATGSYNQTDVPYTPELAVGAIIQGPSARNTPERTKYCMGLMAFANRVRTHMVTDVDNVASNDRLAYSHSNVLLELVEPVYVSGNILTTTMAVGSNWGTTSNFTSNGWTMERVTNGTATGFAVAFGTQSSLRTTNALNYETIPYDSVASFATGQHNGGNNSAVLIDTTASFGDFTGLKLKNSSKPISFSVFGETLITSNTSTQINDTLSGGKLWDNGDWYQVLIDVSATQKFEYEDITNLGGTVILNKVGSFEVTGTSGIHTFKVRILDASNTPLSDWFTITTNVTSTF